MVKKCNKCKVKRGEQEFYKKKSQKDGLDSQCKNCRSESSKQYYKNNIDKIKIHRQNNREYTSDQEKLYYQKNKDKISLRKKQHYKNNRSQILLQRKQHPSDRYNINEQYKITCILRSRLTAALKYNQKYTSAIRDLGCSIEFLLDRLRTNFGREPDKNTQIDHIMPAKFLDLSYYPHQRLFCHYSNLRYMDKYDNLSRDYEDIKDNQEIMSLVWDIG
jgi:hypothetical protein